MSKLKRLIILFFILMTCVGCDQATKSVAQQHLALRAPISLFHDVLRFEYAENPGAFLSLGASLAPEMRMWVFTLFVSSILVGLLVFIVRGLHQMPLSVTLALTLYLAGGLGNLLDRLLNDGHVIDFMVLGIGSLRTGVFNVADMLIMTGTGLLLLMSVRHRDIL